HHHHPALHSFPTRRSSDLMVSMLDLMPAPGLIYNEWDKHGTCSGLSTRGYFETIRKARAAVKIPEEFLELSRPKMIAPEELEARSEEHTSELQSLAYLVCR